MNDMYYAFNYYTQYAQYTFSAPARRSEECFLLHDSCFMFWRMSPHLFTECLHSMFWRMSANIPMSTLTDTGSLGARQASYYVYVLLLLFCLVLL